MRLKERFDSHLGQLLLSLLLFPIGVIWYNNCPGTRIIICFVCIENFAFCA